MFIRSVSLVFICFILNGCALLGPQAGGEEKACREECIRNAISRADVKNCYTQCSAFGRFGVETQVSNASLIDTVRNVRNPSNRS